MIRRVAPAAGFVLIAALSLTSCAPPAAAPTAWQQSVQTVADQASTGDYSSALASLDALEADVIARRDAGEISSTEADGILSRIASVRADLTSLVPTPSPTPSTQASPEPSTQSSPEPSQEAVTDDGGTAPSPQAPDDKGPGGKDDKAPGNGNGNENGKGPGKKDG